MEPAEQVGGHRVGRGEAPGLPELVLGRGDEAEAVGLVGVRRQLREEHAQGAARARVLRLQGDHALHAGDGLEGTAVGLENVREAPPARGVAGVAAQGLPVLGDRLRDLAGDLQGLRQLEAQVRPPRLREQGGAEPRDAVAQPGPGQDALGLVLLELELLGRIPVVEPGVGEPGQDERAGPGRRRPAVRPGAGGEGFPDGPDEPVRGEDDQHRHHADAVAGQVVGEQDPGGEGGDEPGQDQEEPPTAHAQKETDHAEAEHPPEAREVPQEGDPPPGLAVVLGVRDLEVVAEDAEFVRRQAHDPPRFAADVLQPLAEPEVRGLLPREHPPRHQARHVAEILVFEVDRGAHEGRRPVVPVGEGAEGEVDDLASDGRRRHELAGAQQVAHREGGDGEEERADEDAEVERPAPPRRRANRGRHRRQEQEVDLPLEDHEADRGAGGEPARPPGLPVADDGVEGRHRQQGREERLHEERFVEEHRTVEGGEEPRDQGLGVPEEPAGRGVDEDRRQGAEEQLHGEDRGVPRAEDRVQDAEEIGVEGPLLEDLVAAPPVAAGDLQAPRAVIEVVHPVDVVEGGVEVLPEIEEPDPGGDGDDEQQGEVPGEPFPRLDYLEKSEVRKEPQNKTVYLSKTRENIIFVRTLIENRIVRRPQVEEPLKPGKTLCPKVYVTGDETRWKIDFDGAEFDSLGYFNRELNYLISDNTLHLIELANLEKMPREITVIPEKLGELLFTILPRLRERINLEIDPAISSHQLMELEPEISLDFDLRNGQIICRPELKIGDQKFRGCDCLTPAEAEPRYTRSESDPQKWFTVNRKPLRNFLKFLRVNNFETVPEGFTLSGANQLAPFMFSGLREIPPDWKITTSPGFQEYKITPVKLEPVVELNLSDDIDWFEFKIYYNLGGKTYTHQEILKMIHATAAGERYIHAENGVFLVEESGQADLLEDFFRPSATKSGPLGEKLFNLLFYRQVLREHGVKIEGNAVYDRFEEEISGGNPVETCVLPEGLQGELRKYQKEGFHWLRFLYKYHFSGILADDMGLGKTLQVLTLVKSVPKTAPVLVVCPRTLMYNWAAELEKFYPGTDFLVYHGSPEEREAMRTTLSGREMVITTYDILARDTGFLEDLSFEYCILDEAQHIKNYQTQRAREVKKLNAKHRLVMTGTPIENGLEELWSIFDFLMPGYLGSQQDFMEKYVTPLKKFAQPGPLKLLKQRVAPFMLRRRKEDVLSELPEKIVTLHNVFMTQLQEDTYRAILEQVKKDILEAITKRGLKKSRITVLAALTKLRQVCNHPRLVLPEGEAGNESGKLEAFRELVDEAIDAGHKMVVFSQFVKMLKIIETELQKAGIAYEYLDGATPDRMARINRFNETPGIPVFLISLKAGGVGINLTSADIVIHVDPWWNPMVENQATDRVHRIGQKNQVMVYKLITMGTVEEKMLKLQVRKKSVFDAVIENNESPINSLTWEDIRELLEMEDRIG